MTRPIPTNSFQKHKIDTHKEIAAPPTGVMHKIPGIIIEVYDQEFLADITPEKSLQDLMDKFPGLLFAKVRLKTGAVKYLPFAEPEEQIYSTYGNWKQLIDRDVNVKFQNLDLEGGEIHLARTWKGKHINLSDAAKTLDIGALV